MQEFGDFILFLTMFVVGALLEVVFAEGYHYYTKKHFRENHYTLGKYIFLLFFPLLGFILLVGRSGLSLIFMFALFAVVGTFLEWLIGFSYHKVIGQRLWTFHRYDINQYTSWLSLPLWGFIGVVFYLLTLLFT